MNFALVYLLLRTVRGRIVRTLRLLREPKYLIGVLAFFAWIFFTVGMPLFFDRGGGERHVEFVNAQLVYEAMGDALPALQLVVAMGLALLMSLWWLLPWSRMALNLSESEINILTPMPVKRRHLIQYATLKSQSGILFGCTMMTIFLGSGGPLARVGWFIAFWVVLTLWDLHSKGRALWLERQKELPPARAWRNRVLLVSAIAVYWVLLLTALASLIGELATMWPAPGQEPQDFRQAFELVRSVLATYGARMYSGRLGWLLAPFRWVTAPLFLAAPGAGTSLKVTGVVVPVLLLVLQNEWVVRSQAKFEEAALAHARREAGKKDSARRYWKTSRRSRARTPFRLAPVGRPELALLWKNSMIVTRFSYRTLTLLGLGGVALGLALPLIFSSWRGVPFIVGSIGMMVMLLSPLTGSQSYRNDLRSDLQRLEMIRPWPIAGWKLFAAEVAGPSVFGVMSALFGAGLVVAMDLYLTFEGGTLAAVNQEELRVTPETIAAALGVPQPLLVALVILGVLPLLIALTFMATGLQNLLVLLFPGWVQLGHAKQQGAAAFGQNMVMFLLLGLAGIICLLPATLLVGTIIAVQTLVFGAPLNAWEFPLLGTVAATPVFAVAALIVHIGGGVWDRLDASQEILDGGT
jgi:hypothetical protein